VSDPDPRSTTAGATGDLPAGWVSRPGGLAGLEEADAAALLDEVPLSEAEAGYVGAARAANTLRGYRSDLAEFTTWCAHHDRTPLPAAASTVTGYLTALAGAGAKVGTMSRRCRR